MPGLYRERILEHAEEPRNEGRVAAPDATAAGANPHCGDRIELSARFAGETVAAVRFDGEGCALSTAAASLLTEEVQGMDRAAVKKLAVEEVYGLLGLDRDDVNPVRQQCVELPVETARALVAADDADEGTEEQEHDT